MVRRTPVREVMVEGQPLTCPVCRNQRFWSRRSLMNTKALTLLGADWANRQARNEVCSQCGHVLWFLDTEDRR